MKCRIDEQAEASLMSASNLAPGPRVESGERSEVMLAREDLRKTGGRIQTKEDGKYIKEV